ncbi:MAG: DUF1501 domain-containing protein [Bryobacteraceae bacterium]
MRNSRENNKSATSRRDFFSTIVDGIHGMGLAYVLGADLFSSNPALAANVETAASYDLKPKPPHFPGKAKSVIQLFMNGGPSQVDLFDPKSSLEKYAGKVPSRDLTTDVVSPAANKGILPSPYKFSKHGRCGMEISELLPHTAKHADEIALIRSMYTDTPNHEPGLFMIHTGRIVMGRPSLGAWIAYGLGTENQNLPAYVVLDDPKGLPINGIQNWQSAWLPPVYQGTRFRSEGAPVLNLDPRPEWPEDALAIHRNLLRRLDEAHLQRRPNEPDLSGRISSYELAARMQIAASDALDLSKESDKTKEMYGFQDEISASYAKRCLMARRLVERGVRFVQLYIERQIWDNHAELDKGLRYCCGKTDKPIAALLTDLRERGLLDSTLVIWCGEFGRLPLGQGGQAGVALGRDHGPSGFSVWLAGGGVKGGTIYGATDELGHQAVENRVSVHDFHATILHALGTNYRNLVFRRHGLDERLTDQFPARVVSEIIG